MPDELVSDSLVMSMRSISLLTPLVDFIAHIDNSTAEPRLASFERVDSSGDWECVKKMVDGNFSTGLSTHCCR